MNASLHIVVLSSCDRFRDEGERNGNKNSEKHSCRHLGRYCDIEWKLVVRMNR